MQAKAHGNTPRWNKEQTEYFGRVLKPRGEQRVDWRKKFGQMIFQPFTVDAFVRVMSSNHLDVDTHYFGKLISLAITTLLHTTLTVAERLRYSNKLASVQLATPPVFILGHWRSGTTFLHNLMSQDASFTYPKLYQVPFAGCFLLPRIQQVATAMDRQMRNRTRPMDAVTLGMYEPWEDEFIMMALTGISPYTRALFPRRQGPGNGYLYPDFRNAEERNRWKLVFKRLLKRLSLLENKTLLLKSPPHTARIRLLLEIFPEAKFIHIVRHPYEVFVSNLKLWRDTLSLGFLQDVSEYEMVEIIFTTYEQMYRQYHRDKDLIPDGQLAEVRFETLEQDPFGTIGSVYTSLGLTGFSNFSEQLKQYLQGISRYKKNTYNIPEDIKQQVRERWAFVFSIYGYQA